MELPFICVTDPSVNIFDRLFLWSRFLAFQAEGEEMSKVKVSNEYWQVDVDTDRRISMTIAGMLDHAHAAKNLKEMRKRVDELGDYLTDTDVRFTEVVEGQGET